MMSANHPSNRIEQNLEILTEQVGRLTEGLVEQRLATREQHEAAMAEFAEIRRSTREQHETAMAEFAEMREASRQQTEEFRAGMAEIKAVVQQQADTTADLVQIVKQLLNERRQ